MHALKASTTTYHSHLCNSSQGRRRNPTRHPSNCLLRLAPPSPTQVCIDPFIIIYVRSQGLNEQQIGVIFAIRFWVGVASSALWAMAADFLQVRKAAITVLVLSQMLHVEFLAEVGPWLRSSCRLRRAVLHCCSGLLTSNRLLLNASVPCLPQTTPGTLHPRHPHLPTSFSERCPALPCLPACPRLPQAHRILILLCILTSNRPFLNADSLAWCLPASYPRYTVLPLS